MPGPVCLEGMGTEGRASTAMTRAAVGSKAAPFREADESGLRLGFATC